MAFSPGRSVGRVSLRVVPDTKNFGKDLRRDLDKLVDKEKFAIKVDSASVDRKKFRESLQRQLADLNNVDVQTKVKVTVDGANIRRGKLRESIQAQFDQMKDVRVWIRPDIRKEDQERFLHQIDKMIDKAERNEVNIAANAHTLEASAQLRYVTRPRFVDIFVRVSKSSAMSAMTTLAALSGARLAWTWLDDLGQKIRDLDKMLPTIVNWTSGLTALFAAIMGGTSGLAGIGAGLFQMTPALLVLPGLLLNAAGSLTVLFVALRHSKEELGALGDSMNELGGIINTEFWDRARQPIVDLISGLMPQLRNAFRELSQGVGDFTAAMAKAFGQELANGRLESIFTGIAEGWRILGTGASGFAGALVNLSEIAAKYTPRLASWFVRQANTFDAFLTSIATDGRLGDWMEQAIDQMYNLWDATKGFAGVLAGIWRAADTAGSGGLGGFADMMLEWRRVVNGVEFQRGLVAIFRGSYVAMDAFGGAIKSVGQLVADMPSTFERFIGSVGGFIGGLIDETFQALSNTQFKVGLDGLSAGLDQALAGIKPSLEPIAETFGNFIGLLGELAANVLPTAAGVIAEIAPALDAVMVAIRDSGVLETLGNAVTAVAEALGPPLEDFVAAVAPSVMSVFETLADALTAAVPTMVSLVEALGPTLAASVQILSDALAGINDSVGVKAWGTNPVDVGLQIATNPAMLQDVQAMLALIDEIKAKGGIMGALVTGAETFGTTLGSILNPIKASIATFVAEARANMTAVGTEMINGFLGALEAAFPGALGFFASMGASIRAQVGDAASWLSLAGSVLIGGFRDAALTRFSEFLSWAGSIGRQIINAIGNVGGLLQGAGAAIMNGLLSGIRSAWENVKSFVSGIGPWIAAHKGPIAYDRKLLVPAGRAIMTGLESGLNSGFSRVQNNVSRMAGSLQGGFNGRIAGGAGGGGMNVHITQPLLPGETPQEQRDNLIRELSLAF